MATLKKGNGGTRYLTFALDGEVYGIPVLKIKEILAMRAITPLPQTPQAVLGVINLRGLIIPVVDLRRKFGLPAQEFDRKTTIVVLDLLWQSEALLLGVVVDAVHDVQAVPDDKVNGLVGLESRVKARAIRGVAETPLGIRILVDADGILAEEDLASFSEQI